jgi:predicted O-methyltransferase YrrM
MRDFTLDHIQELIEQSLLEQPTGNAFLDARYEEQISIIGHTNPYYRLFYLIAQSLKPAFVVELGSWQGTAAAHFALGWPESRVVTIDIHREDKAAQQRCYEDQA